MASTRACVFTLGRHRFAVDVTEAREVVVFDELTPVPLAPPFVVGVANLRGTVMPMVDLSSLLGLPLREAKGRTLGLVLGHGPWTAAAAVDAVLGLEPLLRREGDAPPPAGAGAAFLPASTAGRTARSRCSTRERCSVRCAAS